MVPLPLQLLARGRGAAAHAAEIGARFGEGKGIAVGAAFGAEWCCEAAASIRRKGKKWKAKKCCCCLFCFVVC